MVKVYEFYTREISLDDTELSLVNTNNIDPNTITKYLNASSMNNFPD